MLTNEQIAAKHVAEYLQNPTILEKLPEHPLLFMVDTAINEATEEQAERIEELGAALIIRNKEYQEIELLCRQSLALNELRSKTPPAPPTENRPTESESEG